MSDRLTAMDIEKQQFQRKVRGFDPEEVELFLRSVAGEFERMNLENGKLLEELGELRGELKELRGRETALQQTLISAQAMAEDQKQRARDESELIIKDARLQSEQLLSDARGTLTRLEADIDRTRAERESFEHRLRSMIDQHLTLLDMRRQARAGLDNVRVLPGVGTEAG